MVWAWFGPAPEAAPRKRTRTADGPAKQHHEVRGRYLGCHQDQERQCQPAVTARRPSAAAVGPALPGCTRCGPELHPGPRGAASLWGLFPAGPSSSTLAPSPLKGRVCGSCPEPGTGKRPGSSAELTTFGWTPLVTDRSGPTGAAKQGEATTTTLLAAVHGPHATCHRRLPVVRWRRQVVGEGGAPAVQSARAAPPQEASKRDPSPTW
jgi:hypothetical protein